MQIVIHTLQGVFIVPTEKQAELVQWLKQNAINASTATMEQTTRPGDLTNKQLISE